ncbi:hypothetical protein F4778DRAFT_237826 [Xylariomycetidae sp. FL2044]|nr:hypothetical protein F4778DRAFT_237826 [Xylariomycetidae sp. FL2044]
MAGRESDTLSSSTGLLTPTHFTISSPSTQSCPGKPAFNTHDPRFETLTEPQAGHTFAIRQQSSGRVLALDHGQLQLSFEDEIAIKGGWHWTCEEENGWVAFQNTVSGTYLGPDSYQHNGFDCCYSNHFVAKYAVKARGYKLITMATRNSRFHLLEMAVSSTGILEAKPQGGDIWEFKVV